jgi:hypothetical protein
MPSFRSQPDALGFWAGEMNNNKFISDEITPLFTDPHNPSDS